VVARRWLVAVPVLSWLGCLVEIREPVDLASATGSGAAGAPATTSAGGGASLPCPEDMVHARDGATVSFCIDRTEVTQTAYLAFLVAVGGAVPTADQPPACSGNSELTNSPDGSCPDFTTGSDLPVWCVDWCDAHAYCTWANKRLCGALAGGPLGFDDQPLLGEWHFACTGGLMTVYPYGDEPDDRACNITGEAMKDAVASHPACEGGFPGMFDMQGNVEEWIDACQPASPEAQCRARGGHTYGTANYWRCDKQIGAPQLDPNGRETGFRCCRDAD
jgi:formylglycine-generating enzyme required for sulfatase activity